MRSADDYKAMADYVRVVAKDSPAEVAKKLEEIATALDGVARQQGYSDPLKGEIEAMAEHDQLVEASVCDGLPLC